MSKVVNLVASNMLGHVHAALTGSRLTLCNRPTNGMEMTNRPVTCPPCEDRKAGLAGGSRGVLDALDQVGKKGR